MIELVRIRECLGNLFPTGSCPEINLQIPQVEDVNEALITSVAWNVSVSIVGVLVWGVLSRFGVNSQGVVVPDRHLSTCARNYLVFLLTCRNMFIVLTACCAVITVPFWGHSPIGMGLFGEPVPLTQHLSLRGFEALCGMTFLLGAIVIIFAGHLGDHFHYSVHNHRDVERTLWLKALPVHDHQTWQHFLLDDGDFKRVEDDIAHALNIKIHHWLHRQEDHKENTSPFRHLLKPVQWLSRPTTPERNRSPRRSIARSTASSQGDHVPQVIERIHVAPVVDHWHNVSSGLRVARERKSAYEQLAQDAQRDGFVLKTRWYDFCGSACLSRATKLESQLARIEGGRKRMSGSAFVTFHYKKHQRHMLERQPGCCSLFRWYSLLSFGRPPFASVTLRCMEAAHPSDVNWQNLHITIVERNVRLLLSSALIVIIMIILVTPVTVTSQLHYIVPMLKRRAKDIETSLGWPQLQLDEFAFWDVLPNQLPTFILLGINSLVVPSAIAWISNVRRDHRQSSSEVVQMHLNLFFLILNTVIIPFLGLTSTSALLEWSREQLIVPDLSHRAPLELWQTLSGVVGKQVFRVSGIFSLRYLLNSTFITNIISLVEIRQLLSRTCARALALTDADRQKASEPWVFAFGYWYAWTISILAIALPLSTVLPSTLPCCVMFFALRYAVDRYNFTHGVYTSGFDAGAVFVPRVLFYMRAIVATWWFIMGCAGFVIVPHAVEGRALIIALVPPVLLILASILLYGLSVAENVAMLSASIASQSRGRTVSAFLRSASRRRWTGKSRCSRRWSSFWGNLWQQLDQAAAGEDEESFTLVGAGDVDEPLTPVGAGQRVARWTALDEPLVCRSELGGERTPDLGPCSSPPHSPGSSPSCSEFEEGVMWDAKSVIVQASAAVGVRPPGEASSSEAQFC